MTMLQNTLQKKQSVSGLFIVGLLVLGLKLVNSVGSCK